MMFVFCKIQLINSEFHLKALCHFDGLKPSNSVITLKNIEETMAKYDGYVELYQGAPECLIKTKSFPCWRTK